MVNIFKYVDRFFTTLTNYLTYNWIFVIFAGLFLFTIILVIGFTSRAYEARLIKSIDHFNSYFIDNPQINEDNLLSFNAKMKSNSVPKQLRKSWQQFVLYREGKASSYMSFENCVSTPIKNSTYTRDIKTMNTLAWIFSLCSLILNCYYCFETIDIARVLSNVLLTPIIILLANYIVQIFLNLKHSAIISDLFQNYQYFEANIDKATETLPEFVDYEVLFDRNEIKRGIPILYAYLQKRAEEEQRQLELARIRNVEHEKFNFDDQGIAASLVLERAMHEAENYIAERKKYLQDTEQINSDMTQEDLNYREITKEYNRQMQVSKETFANFKSQLEEASSAIEANYLKKQQQQELDRQRNLERDYDTATERHKKVIEGFNEELDSVEKLVAKSRQGLEEAMKSEFATYAGKVYDEAKKAVEQREQDKQTDFQQNITDLEEALVAKNQELEKLFAENQLMSDKLLEIGIVVDGEEKSKSKRKRKSAQQFEITYQPPVEQETEQTQKEYQSLENEQSTQEYKPLSYEENDNVPAYEKDDFAVTNSAITDNYREENSELIPETISDTIPEESSGQKIEKNSEDDDFDGEDPLDLIDTYFDEEQPEKQLDEQAEENYEDSEETNEAEKEIDELQAILKELSEQEEKIEQEEKLENLYSNEELQEIKDMINDSTEQENEGIEDEETEGETVESAEPIVEKKRAGRPRKQLSELEVNKPARKRGRPRKEETAEQPVKKGRGRPRKDESQDEVPTKNGPGRPRKEKTGEKAVKKGRGRPRKEETASKTAKKGPGRPRKEKQVKQTPVKKGRGRPRKTESVAISDIKDIKDIDAYLKEIDHAIAQESAKIKESEKELDKKSKIKKNK